jgi:hypothetical protein
VAGERWIEWLEIYILKFEIIPLMDRLKMIEISGMIGIFGD